MYSKSELKKRNKARQLEEKKAEKAAKVPNPLVAAQKKKPEEEMELTPNVSTALVLHFEGLI